MKILETELYEFGYTHDDPPMLYVGYKYPNDYGAWLILSFFVGKPNVYFPRTMGEKKVLLTPLTEEIRARLTNLAFSMAPLLLLKVNSEPPPKKRREKKSKPAKKSGGEKSGKMLSEKFGKKVAR